MARNIVLELRNAKGSAEQLGSLARELATLPVDVIVAFQTPVVAAAKAATAQNADRDGVARSEHPIELAICPAALPVRRGNVTGMTTSHGGACGARISN